jgi:putative ABC transport system permease protein
MMTNFYPVEIVNRQSIGGLMATLWQDVKYGIRVLRTSPGFTAVTIQTLALGIGINAAIFSVLHAVLLRPLPYEDADRVVRIDETSGRGGIGVSPPNFRDFQKQNRSFEQVGAYTGNNFVLTGSAEPMRVEGLKVSHNLLSLLGVRPLLGRSFLPEEEWPGQDQVAIVAHSLWQRRFNGDAGLVGRNILLDSRSYLVVGVMPLEFEFPIQAERIEIWTPLSLPADAANLRGAHYLDVIGRLKKNVSLVQAHADLEMIADRLARQFPKFVPGKMIVVRLKQDLVGNVETSLMILAGAMILVLLIATANVASLFLARAAARRREVAVRMALGASRARLVRQLLTESFLLSLLGGMAGILFALWGTEILVAIGPADVPRLRTAQVDGWVLLFALIASLGTGVMVGVAPALPASMSGLHSDLKEAGTRGTTAPRQPLRKMLVLTLALVLWCGAGLLIKTLWKLNSVHPGFDPKDALVAEVVLPESKYRDGEQQAAFFGRLLELIKALPRVDSAGATTNLPLSGTNMVFMVSIEGRPDSASKASFRAISPDYFRAMRIPLSQGSVV